MYVYLDCSIVELLSLIDIDDCLDLMIDAPLFNIFDPEAWSKKATTERGKAIIKAMETAGAGLAGRTGGSLAPLFDPGTLPSRNSS